MTSDSQSGHGLLISAMSTSSVEKRKLLASMSAEPPNTTISRHVCAGIAARAISSKASRSWSLSNAVGIGRTLRPVSREFSAQPPHHIHKSRKARRDDRGIVHPDRLVAREPHDQERHGDAVV